MGEPRTEKIGKNIVLIHDFWSPEACEAWVARAERSGFDEAPVTTGDGPVMKQDVRNNDRAMIDDVEAANQLWEQLKPLLPEYWERPTLKCRGAKGTFDAIGLNERLRFYRYGVGQRFFIHRDGYFKRSDDELSLLTFLVYLTDDVSGGETLLVTGAAPGGSMRVAPQAGLALLFQHDTLHEGATVTGGRKYVLRSDVMYRACGQPDPDE